MLSRARFHPEGPALVSTGYSAGPKLQQLSQCLQSSTHTLMCVFWSSAPTEWYLLKCILSCVSVPWHKCMWAGSEAWDVAPVWEEHGTFQCNFRCTWVWESDNRLLSLRLISMCYVGTLWHGCWVASRAALGREDRAASRRIPYNHGSVKDGVF